MTYSHLNERVIKSLDLPIEERIEKVRSPRWIGYPQAKIIISKLEDLLVYPKSHRMPNLLIVGDTNNGKTMLVSRFRDKHPAKDNPNGHHIIAPTIMVQAPPVPDEGRFYNAILDSIFAPYKSHDRTDKKQAQVIRVLQQLDIKILIIDEIHHILAGSLNRQKTFLNVIKFLGNELQIPIVGVGIKDAFRAIQTDAQLANRFEPVVLPRWEFNEDFLRLLASFERLLPLRKPSTLHETDLATILYSMSEGYIGELSRALNEASVLAIKTGEEYITPKILKALNWVSPSERKRQLDKLT